MGARTARSKLVLLAGLLLAGAAGGLAAQFDRDLPAFVIIALVQGAVWAVAAALVLRGGDRRPALALILGTAVLLRLIALAAPVFLSDDINRYIWDGRVQAAGINPYRYIPTDPELEPLRDPLIFPNINRNNYAPTIYPPVAQMLFLAANRFGETALAVKLVFVTIEAVGIGTLLFILRAAGRPPEHILLYAWHPLPVWEIAGSGHVDAAVVTFAALALAAAVSGRRVWSAVALAAATLVKFFPLVLAPALWRPDKSNLGDWRWPAAFIAVIFAAYLPYIGIGSRALGFLPGYVAEENFGSGSRFLAPRHRPARHSHTARRLSRLGGQRHGRAGDRCSAPAPGAALGPQLGDGVGHSGAVLRLTPLSLVFRLARRAVDRRTMVAGLVAHSRGCPALLGPQDRQYPVLGGVHSVRRLCHTLRRRYHPANCFQQKVRSTACH